MSLVVDGILFKGWIIAKSLIFGFGLFTLFKQDKIESVEPDISISIVYLSNKWWEV